eukprot:2941042-Pleurochrysis_carterae.AAC.2
MTCLLPTHLLCLLRLCYRHPCSCSSSLTDSFYRLLTDSACHFVTASLPITYSLTLPCSSTLLIDAVLLVRFPARDGMGRLHASGWPGGCRDVPLSEVMLADCGRSGCLAGLVIGL